MSATPTLVPETLYDFTPTPTPFDFPVPTPTPIGMGDAPYYDYWPAPPVNPFTLNAVALIPDQPTPIEFSGRPDEAYAFKFEGRAGQTLSLFTLYAGAPIDTVMMLLGPDGYPVAWDDDSGANFNPEIAWLPLWQDGEYRVVVFPYIQGASGSLQLYYNLFEAIELTPNTGPVTVLLVDKIMAIPYYFEGEAGQHMRLTLSGESPNIYSQPVIQVTQHGTVVMTSSVYGSIGYTLDFIVPEDGRVDLNFNYQGTGGMLLDVTLETVK